MHDPGALASQMAPQGLVDEFGFPLAAREMGKEITMEDLTLIRYFLQGIQDSTLSRGIQRVIGDLLERLTP